MTLWRKRNSEIVSVTLPAPKASPERYPEGTIVSLEDGRTFEVVLNPKAVLVLLDVGTGHGDERYGYKNYKEWKEVIS